MKSILSLVAGCIISLSVISQAPATLTVVFKGNQYRQVMVDGKTYTLYATGVPNPSNNNNSNNSIIVTDLQPGQHELKVIRSNNRNYRNNDISTVFTLRKNFDKTIVVEANGTLQQSESRKSFGAGSKPAMGNAQFRNLLASIQLEGSYGRRTRVRESFESTGNYFTTQQAMQLLQLITPESPRLELAKVSYRSISDPWNFNQMMVLFTSQTRRDELTAYADAYIGNNADNTDYGQAMSDASFNILYRNVQTQFTQAGRVNQATIAFNKTGNYFTSSQVKQLLLLITNERNRLDLAKLSYRTVTDPLNFTQVSDLFTSYASRNDLATYIRSQNQNETAMSDSRFTALYQDVRNRYSASAKTAALAAAFSNTTNFYTTSQARQLLLLISAESDRLALAKQSYRGITDPANFKQVYDVLSSQYSRNQLEIYVSAYYGVGGVVGGADYTPRPPMADVSFNAIYRDVQFTFGLGAKMSELTKIFANPDYYFSTEQAERLIRLVSDESNRLQLAKAAYSHITDTDNFSQLYDVLDSQSSRNELDSYVKNYGGNTGYDNNGYPYHVAMADYQFRNLYSDISNRFGLGAKMTALTNEFAKPDNYFTVVQAEQLIRLVSAEENRLQLAKQAYSRITDQQNIADIYDMFTTQASIDEFKAYIRYPR